MRNSCFLTCLPLDPKCLEPNEFFIQRSLSIFTVIGSIFIDKNDIKDIKLHSLRQHVGLVSQDIVSFQSFKIFDFFHDFIPRLFIMVHRINLTFSTHTRLCLRGQLLKTLGTEISRQELT